MYMYKQVEQQMFVESIKRTVSQFGHIALG